MKISLSIAMLFFCIAIVSAAENEVTQNSNSLTDKQIKIQMTEHQNSLNRVLEVLKQELPETCKIISIFNNL